VVLLTTGRNDESILVLLLTTHKYQVPIALYGIVILLDKLISILKVVLYTLAILFLFVEVLHGKS